jgi:hypothetical protein
MQSLLRELQRRNVIRVGVVYVIASWLILQVADVLFDFSWVYELTPDGVKREKDIDRRPIFAGL